MQGPPDKTDQGSGKKNMIPLEVDKRSGKRSMRGKVSSVAEFGTCNVCSAPCSSCMHLTLARTGTKEGEMSDESCHLPATSQNSINGNTLCVGSETSNLLSVNSNHDTFCENAESKVDKRSYEVADVSTKFKMLPKLMPEVVVGGDQICPESLCSLQQRSLSDLPDDSKPIEGLDDNISCVSRANEGSTVVNCSRENADKKNLLHISNSGCGEAASDAVNQEKSTNRSMDCSTSAKTTIDSGSGTICVKLEAEDKVSGDQPDEVLDCLKKVGEEKKSNELPNIQEPTLQSVPENDTDESEIMEHDVKVCDICGDAGREDLLAVCSRCTDGAEHTYCMREMLQKVPEGDWLCEECKQAVELANRKQDAEEKAARKEKFHSSGKRPTENAEMVSSSKRQAIETSSGSPRSSGSGRTQVLSRESSFKSSDKGKIRSAHQASSGVRSSADLFEMARTSTGSRLQNQRGVLSKSSSFSSQGSKPKVGTTDEIPKKIGGSRESSSLERKEESSKVLNKSMSLKSVNSGRSSASEPKVKMLPMQLSLPPEKKGLKPITERNAFDRKSLSRIDRPQGISIAKVDQKLTPRGDAGMRSSMSISKEMKVSHFGGKGGNLSRSNSFVSRKGTEVHVMSARASSGNDVSASIDSRTNQVEQLSNPSCNPGRSLINDNESLPVCSPRPWDPLIKGEKAKESSGSRLKPIGVISPRSVPCKKCKEFGHAAEHCAKRGLGEMSGNKVKAAIQAAMLKKPGIYRKKCESEQPDGLSSSNVDGNGSLPKDRFPVLSKMKELSSDEDKTEGQANLRIPVSEYGKQSSTRKLKHLHGSTVDSSLPVKAEDSYSAVQSVVISNVAAVSPFPTTQTLAIPEHEYIWQGAFEVCRSGRYLELCGGIQAHLSTCASPKVLEVVKKLPHKLTLDEVPRSFTWPRQFHTDGAKEDNIALFFFAKDFESFEKHYTGLLDNMIRKDLALKGSFDGIDLLIFPSAQLPESSQRWNMLFFLWGVFRGRKSNCSESSKAPVPSTLDSFPQENDKLSAVTSVQDDSRLAEAMDKETPGKVNLKECESDMSLDSSSQTSGVACLDIGQVESRMKEENSPNRGILLPSRVNGSGDQGSGDQESQHAVRDLNVSIEDMDSEIPSEMDLNTQVTENWHGNCRKRPYMDLSKEVSQTPVGTSDQMQLNKVAGIPTESEHVSKKSKLGFGEPYGSSGYEIFLKDRLVSQVCDLTASSPEDNSCSEAYDGKVIKPKVGSSDGFFFPMELDNVNDPRSRANCMPWKEGVSGDDSHSRSGFPNLELALGAETNTANKGMLPFLVGIPEKCSSQSKPPGKITKKEEEDAVAASLSLSLSFPFPEKESTVTPEPKTDQRALDKRGVNTSLFLFGGLSDK